MDSSKIVGYGGRAAGAYLAYKHFGDKVPGGPWVAALVGWLAGGFLADNILPR